MKRTKNIFLIILLGSVCTAAKAQLKQAYRFEQEIKYPEEGFAVISLKKEGLALFRDLNKNEGNRKKWQLEIVDSTLTKIWSTELLIEHRMNFVGYEYNPKHLYLLFRETEKAKRKFRLFDISLSEKTIDSEDIAFELEFNLSHFTMAGSSAIFGGYVNNEPVVLLYDKSSSQPKVLPGLFIREMKLLDVRANQNESFNVLLTERIAKEKAKLIVRTFDHNGNLLIDNMVDIDPKYSILAGLTSTLEREELIVVGTYAEGYANQALGFVSFVVDPFNEQPVHYTDFSSMDHFLDYLSPKRANRIKVKTQKLKTNGQLPNYTSRVMPFRIDERPDGFYLLAEVYEASNNNYNSYPYGSAYYNPYMSGYYPYGYGYPTMNRYGTSPTMPYSTSNQTTRPDVRMIESLVVKIGNTGKPEKSASIKLDDMKQSDLEQVGDFTIRKDSIFMVYKKEGEIFYQEEIGDEDEVTTRNQSKIKLQTPDDALKDENDREGTTRYWYGNHFYVWGYQVIKDNSRAADKTRKVFYVNRITVE